MIVLDVIGFIALILIAVMIHCCVEGIIEGNKEDARMRKETGKDYQN